MPVHLQAWSESVDQAVIDNLAAVPDDIMFTFGDNARSYGSKIFGLYGIGVNITRARLTSPTLRKTSIVEVKPVDISVEPTFPTPWNDWWDHPIPISAGEILNAQAAENGAGATRMSFFAWVGDANPEVPAQNITTIRATATVALVAYTWTSVALVYDTTLPTGSYQIVGMRVESATCLAARLILSENQTNRPGCIGYDAASDVDDRRFRKGASGVWGTFKEENPPTVQFFAAAADAAETVWLDVIGPTGGA